MTSTQVKNQVRDNVEQGFDKLHKVADALTFPLAPLDGAIHGTARGLANWFLDKHPKDKSRGDKHCNGSQQPQNYQAQPQNYPGQPQYHPPQPLPQNYPGQPQYYPPQPQNYPGQSQNYPGQPQNYPGQPYPGYPSEYPNCGKGENGYSAGPNSIPGISSHQTGNNSGEYNGGIKFANFGKS